MRDFSGPGPFVNYDCIKGHSNASLLTEQLLLRGYAEQEIENILGGNLMRFLRAAIG